VVGDGALELLAAALTDPQNGASLRAYGELFGARAEWTIDPLFAIEAYGLARVAQRNPVSAEGALEGTVRGETYTAALRLHGDAHAWMWGAEGAYQLGRVARDPNLSTAVADVQATRSAWAAAGHVAHTFERGVLQPTVRL